MSACCCEVSPPEFGGNLPDRECPLHGESSLVNQAEELGKRIYAAIQDHTNNSLRSQQSKDFRVGVSDLGFCSERTKRMLLQEEPTDEPDMTLAWLGTVIGDGAEQAIGKAWPNAVIQSTVTITLHGEERTYTLDGHPDVILPDEGILLDVKTDYGLTTIRRTGPSRQQQFQRHCYAKAAWEAGLFGGIDLEDVQVGNVWIDRAGIDRQPYVQLEPFDEGYVRDAAEWLDEVVYAYIETTSGRPTEARKEPPREMCAVVCGFYPTCRAMDTDAEGLLTDATVLTAVSMYREGLDLEKQGRKLKDEGKQHLAGIRGSTGDFTVRWVHVNESVVPESKRSAYEKLDIRPLPKAGKKR